MRSKFARERLIGNLWAFIKINNPELALELQESDREDEYLNAKVDSVYDYFLQLTNAKTSHEAIDELCMNRLTADLQPSRFNYLTAVLKDEFCGIYRIWYQKGRRVELTIKLTGFCKPVFDLMGLRCEKPTHDCLYYAITEQIQAYLRENTDYLC